MEMKEAFYELVDYLSAKCQADEVLLANIAAESSDFVRFNNSLIRQAGSVEQAYLTLELISGKRHAKAIVPLGGHAELDRARCTECLSELRDTLTSVPDDPYLLYSTDPSSSEQEGVDTLPDRQTVLEAIATAGAGREMVGIYAAGRIERGFANSLGQKNYSQSYSFDLDWSFYRSADKAVKSSYAGLEWEPEVFSAKVASASRQLEVLAQEPKTIEPGKYRVYLSPAAMNELVSILCWGGFGLKSRETKFTPLLKMVAQGATLSDKLTIRENTAGGIGPNFQSSGFIKPDSITLIDSGKLGDCLVSPRSAKEYGVETNAAANYEMPESLEILAGDIARTDVLEQLGTGLYVSQLWYLNFSDRPAGRITGMTRFATFWVEDGQVVAPLNVMRFDETPYNVLGENLLGLTSERDFIPSSQTYSQRSTDSTRLPGALVKDFNFTL